VPVSPKRSLFIALVALLIVGSFLPAQAKHALGTQGAWHRPLHIALFAATAALARVAYRRGTVITATLLLLLASSLELAEAAPYIKHFEWPDLRDDAIGIIAGLTLYSLFSASPARNP
jgi:uncharacterized protein YfiM (DUF2279 family)